MLLSLVLFIYALKTWQLWVLILNTCLLCRGHIHQMFCVSVMTWSRKKHDWQLRVNIFVDPVVLCCSFLQQWLPSSLKCKGTWICCVPVCMCACACVLVCLCLLICKMQTHSMNNSDFYVQLPWLSVKCCSTAFPYLFFLIQHIFNSNQLILITYEFTYHFFNYRGLAPLSVKV